ncbi:cob(I)yrinic acid a,c-diamide adenosyltransferase [Chamaesiphon sp. VAR_48_metabat_403]|uniref:cob(I)yrinic acid a,c-diamide adenosyltransferase n=1 Tax=Chamaesiphon sp. VAR_48_metabat_403 TaxID=2964700 RepID=UPI00286D8E5D|nr:cob(I)yrinic acid a,c-diamide adenosyltransferase [Chamaesiphon sp. VAR_48_metabat_403]
MIAQLNSHPENPALDRNTSLQTYSALLHKQIEIVDTPADRFCTEIVADALKLASKGQRVLIVQLLKGGIWQGHDRIVNLAQNLDWIRCNLIRNISISDLNDLELHNFEQLWKHVRNVARPSPIDDTIASEYSLVILDDLSLAIELGLISIEAAIDFLTKLPQDIQLILTGTNPHPALVELAA